MAREYTTFDRQDNVGFPRVGEIWESGFNTMVAVLPDNNDYVNTRPKTLSDSAFPLFYGSKGTVFSENNLGSLPGEYPNFFFKKGVGGDAFSRTITKTGSNQGFGFCGSFVLSQKKQTNRPLAGWHLKTSIFRGIPCKYVCLFF